LKYGFTGAQVAGSPHGAVVPHPPPTNVPGNTVGAPQLGELVITGAWVGRVAAAFCTAALSGWLMLFAGFGGGAGG
jgi:H+/gluconate symporter-like permease